MWPRRAVWRVGMPRLEAKVGEPTVEAMTGPMVLIVDDDLVLRRCISERLALERFHVMEAGTAKESLEAVELSDVAIVLLDIGLPDLDGREACRMMRQRGFTTPVVLVTAEASERDCALGLAAGANDYVTKPFRLNALLARIPTQLR